jgi:hypothetical protein
VRKFAPTSYRGSPIKFVHNAFLDPAIPVHARQISLNEKKFPAFYYLVYGSLDCRSIDMGFIIQFALRALGATGLQEATKSAPILIGVLIWAIVLSIPRYRNSKAIYGAGGFLLAIGLFLIYYTGFERMGGFVFISAGVALMRHPETSITQ